MDYQQWYEETRAMSFDDVAEQFLRMVTCYNGFIHSRHSFETKSFYQVHHKLISERLHEIMARSSKTFGKAESSSQPASRAGNPAWLGFVEIPLTEDDLAQVDDLLNGVGRDYIDEMTALANMGKISVSVQNKSYCATLTVSSSEGTKGLTAWGADFYDALFCLYVKATRYPDWFNGTVNAPSKRG
jgi:hypothetical protein